MISAGLIVHSTGTLNNGVSPKRYDGTVLEARYPTGQNSTNNPILAGDIFVDQILRVWKINSIVSQNAEQFTVNCHSLEDEASSFIKPSTKTTL